MHRLPHAIPLTAPAAALVAALPFAVACSNPDDLACRVGFDRADDGHCYPPPPDPGPPSANDVLDGLGPCVLLKDGDEIDVLLGCIEGACAATSFQTIDAALGGDASCSVSGADWICVWPQEIEASFPVTDQDPGLPLGTSVTPYIRGRTDYEGASADGLGLGVSPKCWTDALGMPDSAVFVDVVGTLTPNQLVWDAYGVEIEDEERADGTPSPDGAVDELTLFGPP